MHTRKPIGIPPSGECKIQQGFKTAQGRGARRSTLIWSLNYHRATEPRILWINGGIVVIVVDSCLDAYC